MEGHSCAYMKCYSVPNELEQNKYRDCYALSFGSVFSVAQSNLSLYIDSICLHSAEYWLPTVNISYLPAGKDRPKPDRKELDYFQILINIKSKINGGGERKVEGLCAIYRSDACCILIVLYNPLTTFRDLEICAMSTQNKPIYIPLCFLLYINSLIVNVNQSEYFSNL